VIVELLKKMRAIFNPASRENGKPGLFDPLQILQVGYHDLCRLAEQIHSHAERAPYPHVANRLRQIATEKRVSASALREKILNLGGRAEEPKLNLKSGKNHWERMVRDLEDQKALENDLSERAFRLAEEAPELSDLLKEIVAVQLPHKDALLDLIARADPQADQS
jgi:hypothetical protein